jgi:acetylglutamate kinase
MSPGDDRHTGNRHTGNGAMHGDAAHAPSGMELAMDALQGRTLVVKYGGAAMGEELEERVAADVAWLFMAGVRLTVVHGGGAEVTALASRLGIEAEFVGGHRRTSEEMLDVAMMALGGKVNKGLVRRINLAGGEAVGICGVDSNLLVARKLSGEIDLGYVGEVAAVNAALLDLLMKNDMIPVIAPIGIGTDGTIYNINADLAAGAVASALGADTLIYMSNIEGIEADGSLLAHITREEAHGLIERGAITGGMIPKITSALAALDTGVRSVRIVDGRNPGALMRAVMGEGGTGVRGGMKYEG